jgi:hypothetical protein
VSFLSNRLTAYLSLHCVFGSPFSSRAVVSRSVCFEQLRNIWNQWIIRIWVGKKTTNGKQDFTDGQRRTPLILQNVQANSSIGIDVAVVNTGRKVDLGWFEWVIGWEMNIKEENTPGIGRVIWTHDGGLPVKHVISNWTGRTIGRRILSQIDKFYII